MIEWHFEVVYFNSSRMHLDIADGVITTTLSIKSATSSKAQNRAEIKAKKAVLMKQGWLVRVTICDHKHAMMLKSLQNGDIID